MDGDLDILIGNIGGENNFLYQNDQNAFSRVNTGPLVTEQNIAGISWADYDNDGDLDVFYAKTSGTDNVLFKNKGAGNYKKINANIVSNDGGDSNSSAWGDIDNDGDLDLFVANRSNEVNFLYRNDGNGVFTKITTGEIVTDLNWSQSAAWADYDGDGYLDLYVTNDTGQNNTLYKNDGGSNNWLKVTLVGTTSNRFGYGAYVRVNASISAQSFTEEALQNAGQTWQMRQMGGGSNVGQNNASVVHFGLGDATTARKVRVEWPSGLVSVLTDVAVNQTLTILEPSFPITLARVYRKPNGTKKAVIKWNAGDVATAKIDFYVDRTPDGIPDFRTVNDGKHKLAITLAGDGPFDILACQKNATTICSNVVSADFASALVSNEPDEDKDEVGKTAAREGAVALTFGNYPNPFNPATSIVYSVPEAASMTLIVYDMLGRQVRTLVAGTVPAGEHTVRWDGRNEAGQPVVSGIYLYRIEAHTATTTLKGTGQMIFSK